MNFEEIMARLKNGESMDTIAKEVEDTLNRANAEFQEQTKKNAKDARLNELAAIIADAATEYMNLSCPDMEFKVTASEMRETLDEMLPLLDMLKDFTVKVTSIPVKKTTKTKSADSPEDVFAKFFKSLNI